MVENKTLLIGSVIGKLNSYFWLNTSLTKVVLAILVMHYFFLASASLPLFSFSYYTVSQEMVCVHLVTLIYSIVIQGCMIHFIVFIQCTPPSTLPQAIMYWQLRPNLDLCSQCKGPTRSLRQNQTEKTSIASGSSRQPVKLMDLLKFRDNWKNPFCGENPSFPFCNHLLSLWISFPRARVSSWQRFLHLCSGGKHRQWVSLCTLSVYKLSTQWNQWLAGSRRGVGRKGSTVGVCMQKKKRNKSNMSALFVLWVSFLISL